MRGFLLSAAGALALAGCAGMDNEGAPSAMANGSPVAAVAPMHAADYATQAALSDMYEIQAGQLAASRGAASGVRTFGQQMVSDHSATTSALKSALSASNMPVAPPPTLDPRRQAMLAALNGASGPAFDRLFLHQQLMAHQEALALHSGYAQNGDAPTLRTLAGQVSGRVQMHLDMLRSMGAS